LYDGQLNIHLQHCFSVVAVMEHPVGLMRTTTHFLASRFGLQQSTNTLCTGYHHMAAGKSSTGMALAADALSLSLSLSLCANVMGHYHCGDD
jgi:hypothetical protein